MVDMSHRVFLAQDFAIVNPLQMEADLWQHLPHSVVGVGVFGCDEALLPRLVHLLEIEPLQRLELFDSFLTFIPNGGFPFFSALIRTAVSAATLRARVGQRLLLRDALRREHFFRYFDPRVFVHLLRLLSVEQITHLIAPARSWLWFDPHLAQWREFTTAANIGTAYATTELSLAPAQWDAVSRIEIVNRIVQQLIAERPSASLDDDAMRQIDARVRVAVDVEGLTEPDDLVEYAMNACRHGDAFHASKEARSALASVRTRDTSYMAAIGELAESVSTSR